MNNLVKELIDNMFRNVEENDETRALHDELMINCQERFEDLLAGGMSEEEAVNAVRDSLGGMQEVIDGYPRKAEEVQEKMEAEEKDTESSGEYIRSMYGISGIMVESGSHDVEIVPGSGDQMVIRCDRNTRLEFTTDDGTMTVRTVTLADEVCDNVGTAARSDEDTGFMDLSLNELLTRVKSIVDTAARSVIDWVSRKGFVDDSLIHIEVPAELVSCIEVNSASGDVRISGMKAKEYTIRSASGDINLECDRKERIERLTASSASGDIQAQSVWASSAEISSISGDLDVEGDFGDLTCKSVSGDVEVEGTALNAWVKSVSGDVDVGLEQAQTGEICLETTSGDVELRLPADCPAVKLKTSTTIGETDCGVENAGEGAPLSVSASTISGDISIIRG